ncbi:MAG: Apolipoprotein N-acyltransferase / Copper homeostasis protein CutE [Burkholderiaceae bacterium]|jgi:apolipoprotein N-acyltransferase|nr:MAG: Apolipoprotein N-acyltransferase / Copper homeostasis protein CutE [Burkholderiaceae bacterium]
MPRASAVRGDGAERSAEAASRHSSTGADRRFAAVSFGSTLLILVAGAALAASLAWPFRFGPAHGSALGWLQLLALAVLAWQLQALQQRRPGDWRRALWRGWLFAFAWLAGTFWWMFISMYVYGGLPAWMAALAVAALAGLLALYYAIACAAFVVLAPAGAFGAIGSAAVFASAWTLAELARARWFTGFPWGAIGYAQVDGLAVFAGSIGVYGVGWIAAFLPALFVALLRGWRSARDSGRPGRQRLPHLSRLPRVPLGCIALLAAAALLAALAVPTWSRSTGNLAVTLLQGNIPQEEKFQPGTGIATALRWYGDELAAARTPLVVAPETAIPLLPQQLPPAYWNALERRFGSAGGAQAALIGIPLGNMTQGYTNSALGLAPGRSPYEYDKHHLVPFGEFIPPLFRWFTRMMDIPLGDFDRGALDQPSFDWAGQRLAPNICYEDLFGAELAARFADAGTAPTVFVNLSNIGWFGDTVAIDQHLQISRMRALEFERPVIRATNTGATAIIDWRGRVVRELPRVTRAVLVGTVEGRSGLTPYAWWVSRFGLWPLWGFGGLALLIALLVRRGRSDRQGSQQGP